MGLLRHNATLATYARLSNGDFRCAECMALLEEDPQMMCQVADCPNEAEMTRVGIRQSGPARIEVTLQICASCAAEIDAGRFPDKLDFGREDGQDEP